MILITSPNSTKPTLCLTVIFKNVMIKKIKSFFPKYIIETLILIAFMVIGFYLSIFNNGISTNNEDWGTFGDYFGGILNPITSAFAFYLVAKTYNLQKESQFDQLKLAALTVNLNSKLNRVSFLHSEKNQIFNSLTDSQRDALFHLDVGSDIFNEKDTVTPELETYYMGTEEEKSKDFFCCSYAKFSSIKKEIQLLE